MKNGFSNQEAGGRSKEAGGRRQFLVPTFYSHTTPSPPCILKRARLRNIKLIYYFVEI
jgi:hypothetical protein